MKFIELIKRFPGLTLLYEKLRLSFWLVPGLFVILSFCLFLISGTFSYYLDSYLKIVLKLKPYPADGAQLLLSTSAGALMTVVGVVFSITVLVLQQVSSQYSPRVISSFIKSRSSQAVLGAFMGTFLFNILLLAEISDENVQQAPLYIAIFMILCCVGLLVHFIHHISHAIQSTSIIEDLRHDGNNSYKKFQKVVSSRQKVVEIEDNNTEFLTIKAKTYGYVQGISFRDLSDITLQRSVSITLLVQIGDLVDEDTDLWRIEGSLEGESEIEKKILSTLTIGSARTNSQDFRFGIRQLTDIALKALSPGVNDPSTAVEALNSSSYILKSFFKYPCDNKPLVISDRFILNLNFATSEEAIRLTYGEIIEASLSYSRVLRSIRESIENVSRFASNDQKKILHYYLGKLEDAYAKADVSELDDIANNSEALALS